MTKAYAQWILNLICAKATRTTDLEALQGGLLDNLRIGTWWFSITINVGENQTLVSGIESTCLYVVWLKWLKSSLSLCMYRLINWCDNNWCVRLQIHQLQCTSCLCMQTQVDDINHYHHWHLLLVWRLRSPKGPMQLLILFTCNFWLQEEKKLRSFTEPSFCLSPHSTGRRMQTLTTPAASLANLKR